MPNEPSWLVKPSEINYDVSGKTKKPLWLTEGSEEDLPPVTPEKTDLQRDTEKMSGTQRFVAGVGGGLYGSYLGAKQLGADIGNKVGLVSDETRNNLRQQGSEHKEQMNALKMDKPGLKNPASWGEFAGQSAAWAPAGGFGGKALSGVVGGIESNVLRNALIGAGSGTAAGTAMGATEVLKPGDNRIRSAAMGGAGGAVLGGVLGGAGGLTQSIAEAVKGRVGPLNKRIDFYLQKIAPYSPSKFSQLKDREAGIDKRAEGVKTLYKLKDELKLPDKTGEMVSGRLPETQFEFLEYISQAKDKLFGMYDSIASKAESGGLKVSPSGVQTKLQSIIDDSSGAYTIAQKRYAKRQLADFAQDFTPRGAQERIAGMNEKLANYYTNKDVSFAGNARIEKDILDTFRKSLTETINTAGPQYADLRKAWGSVNELEADAVRKFERDIVKKSKQDPLNFLAAEQVLYAVAKGNPKYLIPATGTVALKSVKNYLVNPNRAVRRMFDETGKALKNERILDPNLVQPHPVSPPASTTQQGLKQPQAPIEGEIIHPQLPPPKAQLPPGQGFKLRPSEPVLPTAANAQQDVRTNRMVPEQNPQPVQDLGHMISKLRQQGMNDKEIADFIRQEYEAAMIRAKGSW